jgi:SAM-dependent methyltransferase
MGKGGVEMKASDPKAVDALIKHFGGGITEMTALRLPGAKLPDVLGNLQWKHILEIGTCKGLTAAVLAEHAEHVTTIDIENRPICEEVWKFFGCMGRIDRRVVRDDIHKAMIVNGLDFDMCYIDAGHDRLPVQLDFALTKRCGCLLMHDYPNAAPLDIARTCGYLEQPLTCSGDGVGWLLDVIVPAGRILRVPPFAWWWGKE